MSNESLTTNVVAPLALPRDYAELRHLPLLSVAVFYLGLAAVLPRWLDAELHVASVAIVVSLIAAWAGWRQRLRGGVLRAYFVWALALAIWAFVSSVGAWDFGSAYRSATLGLWLVFIIPGLAWALRDQKLQRVLLTGLVLGSAVYVVTVAGRLIQGKQVLDTFRFAASGQPYQAGTLLGANRNLIDLVVLALLPFLLTRSAWTHSRVIRLLFIALSGVWVIFSGEREGLLGLAFAGLLYALIQPRVTRKLRLVMQAALVGLVIFMGIQYFGGQAAVSTQRLVGVLEGQRTSGDEIRLVVLNKAWRLTLTHPVFGIGTGRFESVFSAATEQGSTPHVREYAATYTAHNTYASVMAEMGFPGLFALIGLLGLVIVRGARARASPIARAAVCAMGVVALLIFFSSALGTVLFLLIALTLGGAIEPRRGVTEKLSMSPLSTRFSSVSRAFRDVPSVS